MLPPSPQPEHPFSLLMLSGHQLAAVGLAIMRGENEYWLMPLEQAWNWARAEDSSVLLTPTKKVSGTSNTPAKGMLSAHPQPRFLGSHITHSQGLRRAWYTRWRRETVLLPTLQPRAVTRPLSDIRVG